MIRTTKHYFNNDINTKKNSTFTIFRDDCIITMQKYVDYLWNNKITYIINEKEKFFDIQNKELDIPTMLSNVDIEPFINDIPIRLSARVKKCLLTQVLGILRSSTIKSKKVLYVYNKKINEHKKIHPKLWDNVRKIKLTKPNIYRGIALELNSICADFQEIKSNSFNGFLKLKSLGDYGEINIPVKFHKVNKKYCQKNNWKMKKSFLVSGKYIDIRWEKETPEIKKEGIIVGADQGINTVLSLSDRQTTPEKDKDGNSYSTILDKVARKKRGSKAFKKASDHRENFVNWALKQLNLVNIKEMRIEKIVNLRFGRRMSRKMAAFTYKFINTRNDSRCEEAGVAVFSQSSTYRSQRCSDCGWVQKVNRSKKEFCCQNCGHYEDADINAAMNHEQNLPDIPKALRESKLNRRGFFWLETGFYDEDGVELTVPLVPRIKDRIT